MEMPRSFAREDAAPSLLSSELADTLSSPETAKMTRVKNKHSKTLIWNVTVHKSTPNCVR